MTNGLRKARSDDRTGRIAVVDRPTRAGVGPARSYAPAMTDLVPFTRPGMAWFALLDGGLVALAVVALDQDAHDRVDAVVALPPRPALRRLLVGAIGLHVAEGLYAWRTARRAGLPVGRWTVQTLVVGFPSTRALRRTVRALAPTDG